MQEPTLRSRSQIGALAFGLIVVLVVAFPDGGYFRSSWLWVTFALCCLAGVALLLRERIEVGRLEVIALGALTALIAWTALSAIWSSTSTASLRDAERGLIYVAALLAGFLLVEPRSIRGFLAGVAIALSVVAGYGLGDRFATSVERDPVEGTLLIEPLGYANALGIMAAIGILLCLGFAVRARSRRLRPLAAAAVPLLLTALALTESRGAWIALGAGLAASIFLDRSPWSARATAGALVAAVGTGLIGVTALGAVGIGSLGPRADFWRVAWHQVEQNVWLGSGSSTFAGYWQRSGSPALVHDAHNLYLEALAELGPIGLLLLVVALGMPCLALASGGERRLAPTVAGAYVAFLVHAGLDWDWEMPAVTVTGLFCGVALLVQARPSRAALGRVGRAAWALASFSTAAVALVLRLLVE